MFFKRCCLYGFFVSSLLCLSACHQKTASTVSEDSGLKIVTSFYPVYSMVKAVSGNLNDVKMIQSGGGIHSFEPSSTDIAAIYDADVFVYHSQILETWASHLSPTENHSTVTVIEASDGMKLDRVAGLETVVATDSVSEKTLEDPHTWLDPQKVAEEAEIISQKLSEKDPKHAKVYKKNLATFQKKTEKLVATYTPIFEKVSQKTFVTQHTAFSYLAKRFGLTQLGIAGISPEQEPTPRQLTEIEDFVETYHVNTIFVESNASDKVAQTVATATGVKLKTLNPLEADPDNGQDFLENLEADLNRLAKELK